MMLLLLLSLSEFLHVSSSFAHNYYYDVQGVELSDSDNNFITRFSWLVLLHERFPQCILETKPNLPTGRGRTIPCSVTFTSQICC